MELDRGSFAAPRTGGGDEQSAKADFVPFQPPVSTGGGENPGVAEDGVPGRDPGIPRW